MAPNAAKRSRPTFSPPRPGKSKVTAKTTSTTKRNGAGRIGKNGVGKNGASARSKERAKQRRRAAAGTMRAILDEADEDKDEEDEREQEEEDLDEPASGDGEASEGDESPSDADEAGSEADVRRALSTTESAASSPEPEFMLAEVVHDGDGRRGMNGAGRSTSSLKNGHADTDFLIPLPLIHRIMQSQFATPETTSLSKDARTLLGTYVAAFVREGIRRCVYERADREKKKDGAVGADATDSGWLEVEDLERIGVQLCLDF